MDTPLTKTEKNYSKHDWVHYTKEEYLKYHEDRLNQQIEIQQSKNKAELHELLKKYDLVYTNNYLYYANDDHVVPQRLTKEEYDNMVEEEIQSELESFRLVERLFHCRDSKKKEDEDIEKKFPSCHNHESSKKILLIYRNKWDKLGCGLCLFITILFFVCGFLLIVFKT
jgi:hypothetical protein